MKTIYLVRHCKYDNPLKIYPGRLPVSLTEEGMEQAERLRKYFQDKDIQKIYSSAVHRCRQTSTVISDKKIPISYDKRLLETFSAYQGFWGGDVTTSKGWDEFYSHQEALGGESNMDVQERVMSFIKEIMTVPEDRILICSHGDPLHFMYLGLKNEPLPSWQTHMGEFGNPDYLKKGFIRPLYIENDEFRFEPIITQEVLSSLEGL